MHTYVKGLVGQLLHVIEIVLRRRAAAAAGRSTRRCAIDAGRGHGAGVVVGSNVGSGNGGEAALSRAEVVFW